MQASDSLVDVDIPKLSESPWPGIDIFCAMGPDSEGIRLETNTRNGLEVIN